MNLIPFLSSVKAPKSLWVTLINWVKSSVGNLGWTIILVTVLIKLVTTPLDFWVKFNTKRQTLIQQKCAPQIAKLQKKFGADRQALQRQSQSLYKIARVLKEKLSPLGNDITLGVENMHMTEGELPNDNRRFGYIPEQCIAFMNALKEICPFKVGINFDIGHARNNAPYSSIYQISSWLTLVGKHAVGYHIHQVTLDENGFNNHMPITDVYGSLISYASLFKCLEQNSINYAPFIMEMRPDNAYPISLSTFKNKISI